MISYDELDDEIMFNDNAPECHKLMELSKLTEDMSKGKCIGRLAQEYREYKKGSLVYFSFHREFGYHVFSLYKITNRLNEFTPIEHLTFESRNDLKKHLNQIKVREDKYYYVSEERLDGETSILFR